MNTVVALPSGGPDMGETDTPAPSPDALRGEALIDAVKAEMDAAGLSRAEVSREIGDGVSPAVFSRWLRNDYDGDIPAVEARIARWLETRAEAARRSLGHAGLDRHAATGAAEEIEGVLAYAQATGDVVLIHGPSGRGKSWNARRYCEKRNAAFYLSVTRAVQSMSGLLSRLGEAVGAGPEHASAQAAETAVVARLRDRGALIAIDEAHHLRAALLDELRCIRDVAGCGLALIGEDSIRATLARCPQVQGRIGMRADLRGLAEADVAAIAAGPLGRRPGKAEMKLLTAAARGPGGLHAQRRLTARAWMMAAHEGRAAIGADDLAAAAEEAA